MIREARVATQVIASASDRMATPGIAVSSVDSAGANCPLTKTSTGPSTPGTMNRAASEAETAATGAGANTVSAIGVTLVNRHSSSLVVGNPVR
jgi:hypothetical protein